MGDGQYFTDIAPGTMSFGLLSRTLYNNEFQTDRVQAYVIIDVTGLTIKKDSERPVYLVPNTNSLSINGRIVAFGPNWEPAP